MADEVALSRLELLTTVQAVSPHVVPYWSRPARLVVLFRGLGYGGQRVRLAVLRFLRAVLPAVTPEVAASALNIAFPALMAATTTAAATPKAGAPVAGPPDMVLGATSDAGRVTNFLLRAVVRVVCLSTEDADGIAAHPEDVPGFGAGEVSMTLAAETVCLLRTLHADKVRLWWVACYVCC